MTIKEEADKILQSRKIWGNIWDEYEFETLMDIIIGKTQRTWNLLEDKELRKVVGASSETAKTYNKVREELIDIYNYARKLKDRYNEQTKGIYVDICMAELCEDISKLLKKEIVDRWKEDTK